MFEVGPCVGAGCTNITEAKRQDELNKLEFVFLYNNERFDLTARDKDLVVKESIVQTMKINPKGGPITFSSTVTQAHIEESYGLIF